MNAVVLSYNQKRTRVAFAAMTDLTHKSNSDPAPRSPATVDAVETTPLGPGICQAIVHVLLVALIVFVGYIVLELIGRAAPGFGTIFTDEVSLAIGCSLAWPTVIWLGIRNTGGTWRSYFPFRRVSVRRLAMAIVGVLALRLVIIGAAYLAPFYDDIKSIHDVSGPPILSLLVGCLIVPVCEELFFRGWVLSGFLARYSPARATMLSALLFAVIHINPIAMVFGFALGCYCAWLVRKTGSLLPAIAAHAANNSIVIIAAILTVP